MRSSNVPIWHTIRSLSRATAQNIWRIGQILTEVKAQLPHGEFRDWIKKQFDWERSTADNFMNVFERIKCPNFEHFQLSALYLLAKPSTPEPVREAAVERAAGGEAITHEGATVQTKSRQSVNPDGPQRKAAPEIRRPDHVYYQRLPSCSHLHFVIDQMVM
jgi:hypothetical protein